MGPPLHASSGQGRVQVVCRWDRLERVHDDVQASVGQSLHVGTDLRRPHPGDERVEAEERQRRHVAKGQSSATLFTGRLGCRSLLPSLLAQEYLEGEKRPERMALIDVTVHVAADGLVKSRAVEILAHTGP